MPKLLSLTARQKKELEALAAMPDEKIDFSDIPEITDKQWTGAVRGLFARPETRHISIRLSAVDLVIANKPAAAKGLPYQTYIKSLLHESLVKEIQNRIEYREGDAEAQEFPQAQRKCRRRFHD